MGMVGLCLCLCVQRVQKITSDEETSKSQIDLEYQKGLLRHCVFDDKAVICKTTFCPR